MNQLTIDYTQRRENNKESQSILEANKDRINKSCAKVLELLKEGHRLTVRDAIVYHNISSLPRRIKDLREHGIVIKDRLINGRYKIYYL
jgi:hypothetical protein